MRRCQPHHGKRGEAYRLGGGNTDGYRKRLGLAVRASQAESFWTRFICGLTGRELCGVKLPIAYASRWQARVDALGLVPNKAAIYPLLGATCL